MSEIKSLQPHQQRVVDEWTELKNKIENLAVFINESEIFKTLIENEKIDLTKQLLYMTKYLKVLESRISRF